MQINLGELAFTANEIRRWPHSVDTDDTYQCIADHCNRILAEKLARAKQIYCDEAVNRLSNWTHDDFGNQTCTHTARLVCVERLEKSE